MQLVHQCTARRYGFPSVGGPRAGGLNVEDLTWRFSDSAAEGETLLQTLFSLLRFFFFTAIIQTRSSRSLFLKDQQNV